MIKKIICFIMAVMIISTGNVFAFSDDVDQNIALGKPVWATDQFSTGYIPQNVNDGSVDTAWASGGTMLSGLSGNFCYIAIDLGKTYNITSFTARSRRDIDQEYNRAGWIVHFSNDVNFQSFETVGKKISAGDYASDLELTFDDEPKAYRYVRVAHEKRSNMVISEIEVKGDPYFEGEKIEFTDTVGKTSDSARLLNSLGIMGAIKGKEFGVNMGVSRQDALFTVFNSINYKFEENTTVDEKFLMAEKLGIISSAAEFRPREFVTVMEFKKMMLSALGYGHRIKLAGDWKTGVIETADYLGWKNISYQQDSEFASRETVANILYSALMSPAAGASSYVNGILEIQKGNALISEKFALKLYSGVVTANNVTNFYEYSKKNKNFIEIEYTEYIDENDSLGDFIGRKVLFLVKADDEKVVVDGFICAKDEEKTELAMKNIVSYEKGGIVYKDADGNKDEIELSDECVFIKNGVAKTVINESEFKKDDGDILLVDNDKDSRADVVFINAPLIAVNDYCSDDGKTVKFRGTDGSALKSEYDKVSYFRNGKKVSIEEMNRNALMYCYFSENEKVIRFECYTNKIVGMVNSISDKAIGVDGTEYAMTTHFKNTYLASVEIGKNTVFILNEYSEIVSFIDSEELFKGELYGVLLSYNKEGIGDVSLKLFTQNKEILVIKAAEKFKIDGVNAEELNIKDYLGEFIIFRTNYLDMITEISTSKAANPRIKKHDKEITNAWYYGDGIYESDAEDAKMVFPVDSDTIVFTIPYLNDVVATSSEYHKNYSVGKFSDVIKTGNNGKMDYYNVDDFLTPKIIIRKTTATASSGAMISTANPGIYVFLGCNDAYRNDDFYYEFDVLNVSTGEKSKKYYKKENEKIVMYDKMLENRKTVFKDGTRRVLTTDLTETGKQALNDYYMLVSSLKKGDIIRGQLVSGVNDEFLAVDRMFTPSRFVKSTSYLSFGEFAPSVNAYFKLRSGTLKKISDGKLQLNVGESGEYYTSNYLSAKKVFVIDGNVQVYSTTELPAHVDYESKVVILCGQGKDNAIFVYN